MTANITARLHFSSSDEADENLKALYTDPLNNKSIEVQLRGFIPSNEYEELTFLQRLIRETHLVGRISHPNIVPLLGWCRHQGRGWAVYPTYPWDGLSVPGLEPAERLAIVLDIGIAIEYCHSKGLIHGNVNPGAVKISEQKRGLLFDFARAKAIGHVGLTTDVAAPEKRFTAPEALYDRGNASLIKESDTYSFAMTAIYMLSGEAPPFYNAQTVLSRKDFPGIEENVWSILMDCQRYDPRARPHMHEVIARLRSAPPPPIEI